MCWVPSAECAKTEVYISWSKQNKKYKQTSHTTRLLTTHSSVFGVFHSLELLANIRQTWMEIKCFLLQRQTRIEKKSSFPIDFILQCVCDSYFFFYLFVCCCPFFSSYFIEWSFFYLIWFLFSFKFNYTHPTFIDWRILTFSFIGFYSNILLWFISLLFVYIYFFSMRVQMCDNAESVNLLMANSQ